ncbi:MAG: hypothetical protein ACRDHW_15240 [Ktedonobacteraceae bacterium]
MAQPVLEEAEHPPQPPLLAAIKRTQPVPISFTFTEAGAYQYHCQFRPAMLAMVFVQWPVLHPI